MDAFVIFLLAAFGSMIIISLKLWQRPLQWLSTLTRTENVPLAVAVFTAVLAVATCVQVWAFMQSERAFLVVNNLRFLTGEPTTNGSRPPFTLIMTITNPGRNVAIVKEVNISAQILDRNIEFPDAPKYAKMQDIVVIPTIAPGNDVHVPINGMPQRMDHADIDLPQIISDLMNGGCVFFVFGYIKYNNGYNMFGLSQIGYCFEYMPPNQRIVDVLTTARGQNIFTRASILDGFSIIDHLRLFSVERRPPFPLQRRDFSM